MGDELGKGVIDVVKKKTDDVLALRSPGERPSRRYIRRKDPVATTGTEWPVTLGLSLALSFCCRLICHGPSATGSTLSLCLRGLVV